MAKRILNTIFGASKIYVIREIIHLSAIKVPMAITIEAIASQKEYFDTLQYPIFERMIFDNVWNKLNYHLIKLNDENDLSSSFDLNLNHIGSGQGENTTVHFFEGKYHFFHNNHNENKSTNHFEIIINKNQYINLSCTFPHYLWFPLDFENIENIKIYKNNTFIKEIDLTDEEDKKWITEHSCIIKR